MKALEQKARMEQAGARTGGSAEKIDEDVVGRGRAWLERRAYPAKTIPYGARLRAMGRKAKMRGFRPAMAPEAAHHSPPSPGICNWTSAGPRNINGRIRCLAVHPTNGNMVYAGAAEGGVWRSTDAGQSWVPLMQYEMSLAIGALAIDPANPSVLYAGTGEPTWWPGYEGVGVLKSLDGGLTWSSTGSLGNGHIARLAIDPANTQTVYCAGFDGGLHKTTNGGGSWTLVKAGDVTDFVLDPTTPTTQYLGIRDDGVYKSTDGAATWTKLAGGLPATASQRVMLSLAASSPLTVYAKLDQTVYKTTDGGTTWTNQGNHGSSTYGYWCTYIAVDPTDDDIVFAAGVTVEKSNDGGSTWSAAAGSGDAEKTGLHADQHALVFDPTNHLRIYSANDGGVYLSTDGAATWKKASDGLIVTQFYDVGTSAASPTFLGGGTQDQGTNVTAGGLTWSKVYGADGGFLVFHPADPYILYGETQYNNIIKSADGGAGWAGATTGLTGSGPWIGAIALDDSSPDTLFTGRQVVFRTTNGAASWAASSPAVVGSVSAVSISPSDHDIVYAGTSSGYIWRSSDGGATLANWTDRTAAPLPNRFLADIGVDRSNADIVYLAFSGFDANTPAAPGHVFRSADGGATWTNISGTPGSGTELPDIPVSAIEIDAHDADTLYIGTDIGVFRTDDQGATWSVFEPGFPHVAVTDLVLDEGRDLLRAATHGRGLWQIEVGPAASCANADLYVRDDHLDTGEISPSPSNVVDPLAVVRGGSLGDRVYFWQSPDVKIDSSPYYAPDAVFDGVEFDRDVVHDNPVRGLLNKVYVQVHNRGPFNAGNVSVKILWADATAGVPALPADFWTSYPNDSGVTSVWHPIGTYQTITVLEPTRPVVLTWDWTPPASAATHSCLLAVVDSLSDPIPAASKVFNTSGLIKNEKRVSLKNLHVINAPPGPAPAPFRTEIQFHNDTKTRMTYDFVFLRESFPADGRVILSVEKIRTSRPLSNSVEGIEVAQKERGRLYGFFSRLFPFLFKPEPIRFLVVPKSEKAVVRGVVLEPRRRVKARIEIVLPESVRPGDVLRFTIMQVDAAGQVAGGSTYEIRARG